LAAYERAILLNPSNPDVWLRKAQALGNLHDFTRRDEVREALKQYRQLRRKR
jgi:cytochrome c-type biogenesis protein CcmH/NrfG